MKVRVKVRL